MLNNRLAQLICGALLSLALVGLLPSLMFWLDLNAFEKQQLQNILTPRLPLLGILSAAGLVVPVLFFGRFYHRHLHTVSRVQQRLHDTIEAEGKALPVDEDASPEERAILNNANALMATVQQRRQTLDGEITKNRSTQQREKTRLTALLNELSQGVLVCNLEGQILMVNGRARTLLTEQSTELMLGDSLFSLLDAELITHALSIVRERLEQGTQSPHTCMVATTRQGKLLRIQLAAAVADPEVPAASVEGFVLTLDDIDQQHAQSQDRDKLLHGLTRDTRNLLTRLRTGLDSLRRDPAVARHQLPLVNALAKDTARHCDHLQRMSFQRADQLAPVWPLEPILASDLLNAVQLQLSRHHQLPLVLQPQPLDGVWIETDSYSLARGLSNHIAALVTDWDLDELQLTSSLHSTHRLLFIQVRWLTGELRQEDFRSLMTTTRQPVAVEGRALVDLIECHGGHAWLASEQPNDSQQITLALPLCEPPGSAVQSTPVSEIDFSETADSTSTLSSEGLLKQQVYTVLSVGYETNAASHIGGQHKNLCALLLAGGKPQSLAQKNLQNVILSKQAELPQAGETSVLDDFARNSCFVVHDSGQTLSSLSRADRQLIAHADLLDTAEIAKWLFPGLENYSLYQVCTRLGFEASVDNNKEQVELIARVFNRLLTRLQNEGIHNMKQLRSALQQQHLELNS